MHAFDLDRVAGRRADVRTAERARRLDDPGRGRAHLRRRVRPGAPRRAPRDRRDHGRRRPREVSSRPPGVRWRPRPGTARTSFAPRESSGCARRPSTASRSSSPSSRSAPTARRATMVELCGAGMSPAPGSTWRPSRRRRGGRARAGAPRLLGDADRAGRCVAYPRAARLRRRAPDGRPSRGARFRYYDVSREADLVEASFVSMATTGSTFRPRSAGAGQGRVPDPSRRGAGVEDVVGGTSRFDGASSASIASPTQACPAARPRRCRAAPIRVSNPLSLDHSELWTTLLAPPSLDAARYNLASAPSARPVRVGAPYLAQGPAARGGEFASAAAHPPSSLTASPPGPRAHSPRRVGATERPTDDAQRHPGGTGGSVGASVEPVPFLHPGVRHGWCWCRGRMARRGPSARLSRAGIPRGGRPHWIDLAGAAGCPSASSLRGRHEPTPAVHQAWPSSSAGCQVREAWRWQARGELLLSVRNF